MRDSTVPMRTFARGLLLALPLVLAPVPACDSQPVRPPPRLACERANASSPACFNGDRPGLWPSGPAEPEVPTTREGHHALGGPTTSLGARTEIRRFEPPPRRALPPPRPVAPPRR